MKHTKTITQSAVAIALMASGIVYAGGDLPTKASNIGSIVNTRHNLTQSFLGANAVIMDMARNNYGEVCVYCHTPHGTNTTIAAPLWNRTNKATVYNTYNSSTITQPVSQPGPNSLSCLSCHDGTVAIDSIINMPGSGGYLATQQTTTNTLFLNTWINPSGINPSSHMTLGAPGQPTGCTICHSATGTGATFTTATSFDAFVIGTDLTNDHPVGIRYPAMGVGVDFKPTTAVVKNIAYFDTNLNGSLDTNEIRLYNTGQGFAVECASCHDPHGVPSNGAGTQFNKTFLRISNAGSGLCLTCHVK